MTQLSIATHAIFATLGAACAEGRTFQLVEESTSTNFIMARGADLRGLSDWMEAHANHGWDGEECFYRVFEELGGGRLCFFSAYIIEGGNGAEGVTHHDDVSFPRRFF